MAVLEISPDELQPTGVREISQAELDTTPLAGGEFGQALDTDPIQGTLETRPLEPGAGLERFPASGDTPPQAPISGLPPETIQVGPVPVDPNNPAW